MIHPQAPAVRWGSGSKRGRQSLILLLGIAVLTSAVFLFLIDQLPRRQQLAAQRVNHTLEVLNVVTSLDADLAAAISEARGFMIDQKVETTARFEALSARLSLDLASLWILTADNPAQQSALARMQPLISDRIQLLRDIIDALNAGTRFSDPKLISQGLATSQALTDQISEASEQFKQRERDLLVRRRAKARSIVRLWLGVSLGCGIIAVASGLLVVALLVARNRKSKHLMELRELNAGLEDRVAARNAELAASEAGFRQLADNLLISETRYRLLAETTNDLIICAQLDLRRTYASPACRTVLGYDPEEMLRDERTAVVYPGDAEALYEALYPLTIGALERTLVTYRALHKAGHWIWIEATVSLVRDQRTGVPASLVASLRDTSERHIHADQLQTNNSRLERLARHLVTARDTAERASRTKSRFLAGMSHELRTPLSGILGYAQLLRMEGGLNVAQAARVDAMLHAGRHLLEMIHCILDLSEIEIERFTLQPADFDLHRLANACLDLVRPAAKAKSLVLSVSIAPDVPVEVRADPTRLRQVLLNLLGNAVKFTTQGTVELRVMTTSTGAGDIAAGETGMPDARMGDDGTGNAWMGDAAMGDDGAGDAGIGKDGAGLRFEVADTGPGIAFVQRRRLFQEFERLDTEATRTDEGAALGLSIAAQLATLMGGRIGHDDNPAGGSIFWLQLPLVRTAAAVPLVDALTSSPLVAGPGQPSVRLLDVLVVDDIAMNRDIASSFLRAAGHKVTCVEGGHQAVAAAGVTDFDVVLMDVRMPEMDGLEATRRIRALPGLRGRVPIIALTAQAFADQVADCRDAGMDSHLAKPFDPDTLRAAVLSVTGPNRMSIASPISNARARLPTPSDSGSDLPVFDLVAFDRTAGFLTPGAVTTYLSEISRRGLALSRKLQEPDALSDSRTALAEAAHTLAGSAGMFGFDRLAFVGRHFERAVQTGGIETLALAASLGNVLEATLQVIRDRVPVGAAV
jgi:PAS domain S-box-containing protein